MRYIALVENLDYGLGEICFIPNTFRFKMEANKCGFEVQIEDNGGFALYGSQLYCPKEYEDVWESISDSEIILDGLYDRLFNDLILTVNELDNDIVGDGIVKVESRVLYEAWRQSYIEFLELFKVTKE